jgi:hypothetical protein
MYILCDRHGYFQSQGVRAVSLRHSTKLHRAYSDDSTRSYSYENLPETLYGLHLGSTEATAFHTRPFVVRRGVDGTLHLQSTGASALSFEEMRALRGDPANRDLTHSALVEALQSPSGLSLSNVGVSVALEIRAHNRRFAVLVENSNSRGYKLISGYCDIGGSTGQCSSPADELLATACREIVEELIVCLPSMHSIVATPLHVRTETILPEITPLPASIPPHYIENIAIDTAHPPLEVKPHSRPSYLAGAFEDSRVAIDDHSVAASFYIDRRYRSGQIVFSFALDLSICDYTLLHAEDSYCSKSGVLKSILHPEGLILAELGPNGRLLGDFFWLREGTLVQRARNTNQKLSEVFTTCSGSPGIIDRGAVSISEYLLNQRALAYHISNQVQDRRSPPQFAS